MEKESKVAVYFNDEYIGEADSYSYKKGKGIYMPQLRIVGDYQAGEQDAK